MGALALARWQYAILTVYHFFFVPLTLGLSVLLAIMETKYVTSGDEKYKRMVKFWGKLFLINFAMGVVTGIVQEFQFGLNWSEYSRFVGDIFGAPLAIEALLAFFLESTFLGVWIFGWDRLSKKAHAAVMWLVAIGSNLSALWILIANSFMQEPRGFTLIRDAAGNVIKAQMTDFGALVFNPHAWLQFPHVVTSGITTAGFFVMGISVYHLFKKSKETEIYHTSLKWGAVYGLIGIILVIGIGHVQMQHMEKIQPMKVAAAEALWDTEGPAGLSLFAVPDYESKKNSVDIRIPYLLSFLAFDSFTHPVPGINQLQKEYEAKYGPGDYVPAVMTTYWTFRIMVGVGFLMLIMALVMVIRSRKETITINRFTYKLFLLGIFLPVIGTSTGWIMTEVGRQPWVVYGLLKTANGVSPTAAVSAGEVAFSLIVFALLYGALMVADIFLLKKYARLGVEAIVEETE